MANRDNHYEAAFEACLRPAARAVRGGRRGPAEPVCRGLDQEPGFHRLAHGRLYAGWSTSRGGGSPPGGQKQYWKNWSTRDDLVSLARWERLFGERFGGLFVFAYNVVGDRSPLPAEQLFEFRGGLYGVRRRFGLRDYAMHARQISPRWDTLAVAAPQFRQLAAAVETFFGPNRWHCSGRRHASSRMNVSRMELEEPCTR